MTRAHPHPHLRLTHSRALPDPRLPTPQQTAADRQWLTVHGAWRDGQDLGFREGYVAGVRWGIVCGACWFAAGALVATRACLVLGVTVNLPAWWPL